MIDASQKSANKNRAERVKRLAKKLARHYERLRHAGKAKREGVAVTRKRPMRRKETKPRAKKIIAYDLETTSIKAGTPKPLYITAYCDDWQVSMRVRDMLHLAEIIQNRFLTLENKGARFVAWNGNNFDVYLIAAALLHCGDRFKLRPYLTASNNLRGLRVERIGEDDKKVSWEFLDGISMTGLTGVKLKKFLEIFAPDYGKLEGPNFEKEEFDYKNEAHVKYAERDSEGLYHAMTRAQAITLEHFGMPLYPTIGNTGVRIFQRNLPEDTIVWEASLQITDIIRDYVMRGGFCSIARKFEGPTWKYDINQAYAAAMREAWLPSGRVIKIGGRFHPYANAAIYKIRARNPKNTVPFYHKSMEREALFSVTEISDTWLTSIEVKQLMAERWQIEFLDGYFWDDSFSMREFVDKLEQLRMNAPGGPSGAQGTMVKAIGNNSYGKTVEQLQGMEVILSTECPEGFSPLAAEENALSLIWFKLTEPSPREYHQPQIGAFITAHVRMVLRRGILLNPEAWIYADTDCIVFSEPVDLPVHKSRYGYYKTECEGDDYRYIDKKVYSSADGKVKHAKGLNIDRLTNEDFVNWYHGQAPKQKQTQKQNFLRVMQGEDMFIDREKRGSRAGFTIEKN